MISRQILVLGATGMLGQPVVYCLVSQGHRVRALVREGERARQLLGGAVEIVEGSALKQGDVEEAMSGCEAVHVSLTQEAELPATQHAVQLVGPGELTVRKANDPQG